MNTRQLEKLGVPRHCYPQAIAGVQAAAQSGQYSGATLKQTVADVVARPAEFLAHPHFAALAGALAAAPPVRREPVPYRTWGAEHVDAACHVQMREACSLPVAAAAALMPDAHVGYGLPIGGVLALDNAVCPYAVGVDIACRMKLTLLDLPVETLDDRRARCAEALENGTYFGLAVENPRRPDHPVLDEDWTVSRVTRENKDRARRQLGTSGSGNHFVELGLVELPDGFPEHALPPGKYVGLLSHSGSRGTGASVCSTYSDMARAALPAAYRDVGRLAWLDLDRHEGQEYWAAMQLMGDYAAANHDVIHRTVLKLLGARAVAGVENHHNFAWRETHGDRELIVHRKGATPAAAGVLGVIPGSMSAPAYIVRGLGNAESLCSAAHGAGRCMSRTAAREKYRIQAVRQDLAAKGITVLAAGSDEVPYVYKDIDQVMRSQLDLVETVGRFYPRIVKMAADGERAED